MVPGWMENKDAMVCVKKSGNQSFGIGGTNALAS